MKIKQHYAEQIQTILTSYTRIETALIFGSFSTPTFAETSDIDIALLCSEELDLLTFGTLVGELNDALDREVDVVQCTNLFKTNPKLSFNIASQHTVLFCRNEKAYVAFKHLSFKYFLDVKPMLDNFDTKAKERLQNGNFGKTKIT